MIHVSVRTVRGVEHVIHDGTQTMVWVDNEQHPRFKINQYGDHVKPDDSDKKGMRTAEEDAIFSGPVDPSQLFELRGSYTAMDLFNGIFENWLNSVRYMIRPPKDFFDTIDDQENAISNALNAEE